MIADIIITTWFIEQMTVITLSVMIGFLLSTVLTIRNRIK